MADGIALPPRDPIFGPDYLADFQPQDPAAIVKTLNLNALSTAEATALIDGVTAAVAAKKQQNDIFGALQILVGFAGKAGFL